MSHATPGSGHPARPVLGSGRAARRNALIAAATIAAIAGPAAASAQAAGPAPAPKVALKRAIEARQGKTSSRDVTIANRDLARAYPKLSGADRRRARGLLARPDDADAADNGETVAYGDGADVRETCDARFCIHYTVGDDNSPTDTTDVRGVDGALGPNQVPDYVDNMLTQFDTVYAKENGTTDGGLGWGPPVTDGPEGEPAGSDTTGRFDVYIGEIGDQSLYGYAQPEEDPTDPEGLKYNAFMVMDNDYAEDEFPAYGGDPTIPIQVTAAHEYNHVLQFAQDVDFDSWAGEATATWMEDQVFPNDNDWLQYLSAWQNNPEVPITTFAPNDDDQNVALRVYGSAVFAHWLSDQDGRGPDLIRDSWNQMLNATPQSYAVSGFDAGIAAHGGGTISSLFGPFAAASAEWRVPASGFHDRDRYAAIPNQDGPDGVDVVRSGELKPGTPVGPSINHLAYQLYDVPQLGNDAATLTVTAPAGVPSSISLVGRTGGIDDGTTTIRTVQLPKGGTGRVSLTGLQGYSRITAVVANTDTRVTSDQRTAGTDDVPDWAFAGDGATYTASIAAGVPAAPTPPPTTTTTTAPTPPPTTVTTTTTTPPPPPAAEPTRDEIVATLRRSVAYAVRHLRRDGKSGLRRKTITVRYEAPSAGRVAVGVRRATGRKFTLASAGKSFDKAGRVTVTLRPTKRGKTILKRSGKIKVRVVVRFVPKKGPSRQTRKTITIR